MRIRKTKEYKYELTKNKEKYITFLKDFLNQEWNGYYFDDEQWGVKHSFKTTPPNKSFFSNEKQKYEILDWVNKLDNKYHTLFPQLGNRIWIYPDIRQDMVFGLSKDQEKVWNKYKRIFNRILKEILYENKKFYNEEELIVMNLFRELHLLFLESNSFQFWIIGLYEKWGNTKYLRSKSLVN